MQRLDDRSRMSGDVHVRFCDRLEGRCLRATRLIVTANNREVLEAGLVKIHNNKPIFRL